MGKSAEKSDCCEILLSPTVEASLQQPRELFLVVQNGDSQKLCLHLGTQPRPCFRQKKIGIESMGLSEAHFQESLDEDDQICFRPMRRCQLPECLHFSSSTRRQLVSSYGKR